MKNQWSLIKPSSLCVIVLLLCSDRVLAGNSLPLTPWTAQKAVEYALQNSPDSEIATLKIRTSQAMLEEANSALLPGITLGSSYDQTNNPMYSFGNILNQGAFSTDIDFNDPGRTDSLKIKAGLQYTFYNGGKTKASIAATQYYRNSLIAEKTAVLNQLAFEVVATFQKIIQAMEMVETQKSSLAAIDESLKVARARYQAGDLLRQELLNIEVLQARASENLIQARHALSLSQHAFNNLLGLPEKTAVIDTSSTMEQKIPEILDSSTRPEIQAMNQAIAAAAAQVDIVRADTRPSINGFAGYQQEYGIINDSSGNSWMAGITLNYTLFDGNMTDAKIARKRAELAEVQERKRKIELILHFELQQAEQEMLQARERISVTEKMVAMAKESARLNRARFQEGVILSSELIDVETRLTDAQMRNSQAKALYRTAIANLRKTVGLQQF